MSLPPCDFALGRCSEFGIVYLGIRLEDEILRRSAMNQTFLFYEESPSYVTSSSSTFSRVQLPHHDSRQWEGYDQNFTTSRDTGAIDTDFSSTPPIKLGNANIIEVHPQIAGFLKNLELSEQQASKLLLGFKRVLHSCKAA